MNGLKIGDEKEATLWTSRCSIGKMPRMRLLSKHKRYEAQCAAPVIHQVIYEMLPKLAQHTKYHLYFTFADEDCQAFLRIKTAEKTAETYKTFRLSIDFIKYANAPIKFSVPAKSG